MAAGSSQIGSFVWLVRLRYAQGLRDPTDVLLGTLILWVVLHGLGDSEPVWAIISCIVVSDRDVRVAWAGEVLCGSLVVLIISWVLSRFWPAAADLREA
jgi:hypothetical protein